MSLIKRILVLVMLGVLFIGVGILGVYPGHLENLLIKPLGETAYPSEGLASVLKNKGIGKLNKPLLYVTKSELTLTLYEGSLSLKTYSAAMGEHYLAGTKLQEGDNRTPEGRYLIADKRINFFPDSFLGSRWLGISYPNQKDVERGYAANVISEEKYLELMGMIKRGEMLPQKTLLGGELGIHGGHKFGKRPTWTLGCIALTNRDIEELYSYVPVGTPIIIMP